MIYKKILPLDGEGGSISVVLRKESWKEYICKMLLVELHFRAIRFF